MSISPGQIILNGEIIEIDAQRPADEEWRYVRTCPDGKHAEFEVYVVSGTKQLLVGLATVALPQVEVWVDDVDAHQGLL